MLFAKAYYYRLRSERVKSSASTLYGRSHTKMWLWTHVDSPVWSVPSLFANRIIGYYRMYERRAKAWAQLSKAYDIVNDSLKLHRVLHKYAEIFCWKNVSSFCKTTHIFSAKYIRILCIESAKTINKMTLNEIVKITTLWTTGPRIIPCACRMLWIYAFCACTKILFVWHGPYDVTRRME